MNYEPGIHKGEGFWRGEAKAWRKISTALMASNFLFLALLIIQQRWQ